MALLKLLQIRTLFMNDILQYVSLYIYLPLDLNKHRHGAEWPDMFNIHTLLAVHWHNSNAMERKIWKPIINILKDMAPEKTNT